MSVVVGFGELPARLAAALGLCPDDVSKLVIEIDTDKLVTFHVTGLVDPGAFARVVAEVERTPPDEYVVRRSVVADVMPVVVEADPDE